MAHNINTYVGRQDAWHGLGVVTGHYMTSAELMEHEGFQFGVFKSQLHDGLGNKVPAWATFRWDRRDRLAGDASKAKFLGVVGEQYKVIHHSEAFSLVDAIVASADGAHYETAGVLGAGEQVWVLADLDLGYSIGDDRHNNYLYAATGHDGSMSFIADLTDVRVVCQNTLRAAMSKATKRRLTVKHTKNAGARLEVMRETLAGIRADVAKVEERMQFLVGRKVTREAFVKVMDRVFPVVADDNGQVAESSTRRNNTLADILRIFDDNDGNQFREQRGSAYNLLNAVTNWVDHERGNKNTTSAERMQAALFGSGDKLKTLALEAISDAAQDMPALVSMGGAGSAGNVDGISPYGLGELERLWKL